MVVLAVTWMAKSGRESDVAGLFAKLTEQFTATRPSRAAFSSTSNTKMTRPSKRIAPLRTFCNT